MAYISPAKKMEMKLAQSKSNRQENVNYAARIIERLSPINENRRVYSKLFGEIGGSPVELFLENKKKSSIGNHELRIGFVITGHVFTIAKTTYGDGTSQFSSQDKALEAIKRKAQTIIRAIPEINYDLIENISIK